MERVCEQYQKCIPQEKLLLSLHTAPSSDNNGNIMKSIEFLNAIRQPFTEIKNMSFSATTKMLHYLEIMHKRNISSHWEYIYHTDVDEIMNMGQVNFISKNHFQILLFTYF